MINDKRVNLNMIKEARERIKDYVVKTPLIKSTELSTDKQNVYLKLENVQHTRAFKIRGALNKILSLTEEERARGVATISSGNHGIATAFGAKLLGIENNLIIVPEVTPQSKIDKIKFYGGNVVVAGETYDFAHEIGLKMIEEKGMILIDSYYDDEVVYAGQGTIALEVLEDNPEIDTFVVPYGGGGLTSGILVASKSINPDIKVYGVQPDTSPVLKMSIDKGECIDYFIPGETICEAIVGGIGPLGYDICKDYLDEALVVSEEEVEEALTYLALKELMIAEPSSAVSLAGFLKYRDTKRFGKNVVLIISGSNADPSLVLDIINKHKDKFL